MSHYALLDKLKLKLRLQDADETLSEELEAYLTDIDGFINVKLRNKLGFTDVHGNPIILPLTEFTNIPVDDELLQLATDLAYGKFRKEQNNEELNWENAKENFELYLEEHFGWTEDSNSRVVNPTTISYTPVSVAIKGSTLTVSGKNFHQYKVIAIDFAGQLMETSPSTVFADVQGAFKNVTIIVPDNITVSQAYKIKAFDGLENQDNRADAFVSVNVDTLTEFNYSMDAILV